MWKTLSKDMLLYEIIPLCDPEQFLTIMQLNKRSCNIAKQFPTYVHLFKRKRNKYPDCRAQAVCAIGNEIWALYYVNKRNIRRELISDASKSGNINLIKHFVSSYSIHHLLPYAIRNAIKYGKMEAVYYLLSLDSQIELHQPVEEAAYKNDRKLIGVFINYMKINNLPIVKIHRGYNPRNHTINFWDYAIVGATKGNHVELFYYILELSNHVPSTIAYVYALYNKNYELAKVIHELNGSTEEFINDSVITLVGHPSTAETVKYMTDQLKQPDWIQYFKCFVHRDGDHIEAALYCLPMCDHDARDIIQLGITTDNMDLVHRAIPNIERPNWDEYLLTASRYGSCMCMKYFASKKIWSFDEAIEECDNCCRSNIDGETNPEHLALIRSLQKQYMGEPKKDVVYDIPDDSSEDDSNEDDSSEDDSNEDDSNEDDSNEDDSSEDDSNEDDSNEDDSNEDDSNEEDNFINPDDADYVFVGNEQS
jgi:hypothetical protein